ncbi:MAG: phosphodiester glycosidase family protein [Eubacteriales bacterium]|nr:phosphodiester glycosidase family protein [Eubacteriales bacterium]
MKLHKIGFSVLLLVVLLAITLLPSSNVTEQANQQYLNYNEEDDGLSFSNLFVQTANAEGSFGNDITIPIPLEELAGRAPKMENFVNNTYEDASIKVRIEDGRYHDADYHVAYIQIADASQLRTATAGKVAGSKTLQMSDLAPKLNAIVAVNGDFYTQLKVGYIVRQGQVIRKKASKSLDLLLIDDQGNFHIINARGQEQVNEIKSLEESHKIVNGFAFGPALVIDGQIQKIDANYQFAVHYPNPRAVIAQIDTLHYAILLVDGRTDNSGGLTAEQLANLCKELNFKQAYNLDGGNSASLYFKDGLYTKKTKDNERFISDIVYFASAIME